MPEILNLQFIKKLSDLWKKIFLPKVKQNIPTQLCSSRKSVADFEIISQEGSLGSSLLKLLKLFCGMEQDGCQG